MQFSLQTSGHRPLRPVASALIAAFGLGLSLVWASAWAQPAAKASEQLVSSQSDLIDAEFSQQRGQIVWVDMDGQMWVANVDRRTGAILPSDGKGQLIDRDALTMYEVLGVTFNGPEWLPSADGVHIVYTKFLPNRPRTTGNARLALARRNKSGSWSIQILQPSTPRNAPYASTDVGDPNPRITYVDPFFNHYWRDVADPDSEELIPGMPVSLKSVRFVAGERAVVYAAPVDGVSQVFRYDLDSKALEQLTFDDGDKDIDTVPWMWSAPEFGGSPVLKTVVNLNEMRFYRRLQSPGGGLKWTLFSRRQFKDGSKVLSPEPLVYGGQSHVFTGLAVLPDDFSSEIWLVNLSKGQPFMRRLDTNSPAKGRMDPEVFVTERGPFIYYNRFDSTQVPGQPFCPTCSEGVYRIHTGLPAPTP